MKSSCVFAWFAMLWVLLAPHSALAKIYKWVDQDGTVCYSNIPRDAPRKSTVPQPAKPKASPLPSPSSEGTESPVGQVEKVQPSPREDPLAKEKLELIQRLQAQIEQLKATTPGAENQDRKTTGDEDASRSGESAVDRNDEPGNADDAQ
jgi:hypothetical protein